MGVLYRPPSRPPVTAWAKHLDQVMQDRDWSRVRLFEEIGAALGYGPKSRSAILPLLIDKEPTPDQAVILTRHFGAPPQTAPEPATATETPDAAATLIAAMTGALLAQTEALTDLRADFVEARDAASSEREAMTKMLARLEAQLAELQLPGGRAAATSDQASGNR